MWKRKKDKDVYHQEVLTTNSRDIIDGIDTILNTCIYEFQAANALPWQDISKMQTSPNDCRFDAHLLVPEKSLFANERTPIDVNIVVTQGDRASEVRVSFSSKLKSKFWSLHAAKDLLDKLSLICDSSSSSQKEAAGSFRVIAETIVLDLESSYGSSTRAQGVSTIDFNIVRIIATAQSMSPPSFRMSDLAELADEMVVQHMRTERAAWSTHSTYVPIGHLRSFVDVSRIKRNSWLGVSIKQLWAAYQYLDAKS